MLVAVGGLSYDHAGALLKISGGTVKSRVSRARARLAGLLADGRLAHDHLDPGAALQTLQWDEILVPPELAQAIAAGAQNRPHSPDRCAAMPAVLLVEDELLVRELIEEALNDQGLTVHAAGDGAAALSSVSDAEPAVLVTDINLGPGLDGFEVARRARQLRPDLKVVYITGHAGHLAEQGLPDALMVPKPFDPTRLALQVRRWVAEDCTGPPP